MIWGKKASINYRAWICYILMSSGRYAKIKNKIKKKKKTETFEQRPEARQSRDISLPGGTVCPIGKRVCNIPEGRACFKYSRL